MKIKNSAVLRFSKHLCALGALSLLLVTGCAVEPNEASVDKQIGLLAASPTTVSELGVVNWKVVEGDQGIRVIGRDGNSTTEVEALIEPISTDLVQIDILSPETGSVRIHADGSSEGATSEYLLRLTRALYADLGKQSIVASEPNGKGDGIGESASALSLAMASQIDLVWSFFGYTTTYTVGPSFCPTGRAGVNTRVVGGGSCYFAGWTSPITTDCRAQVTVSIVGWQTGTCFWEIYAN